MNVLSREFLYRLEDELTRARYEIDEKYQMSRVAELREYLGSNDVSCREIQSSLYVTLDGRTVEVGLTATNAEIVAALNIQKINKIAEKPKMVSKLQSVAARLGQLKHDSEFDADKLLTRVDSAFVRKDAAFAKSHQFLDGHEKDLADVEGFIAEIEQATNGAPE